MFRNNTESAIRLLQDLTGLPRCRLSTIIEDTEDHYRTWSRRKPSGKLRMLCVPSRELAQMQRDIARKLLWTLPIANAAHGFLPGRSTLTHARIHAGKRVVVTLDLVDFFPSCTYGVVMDGLTSAGLPTALCRIVLNVCTFRGSLPQGAPTSPMLSNITFSTFDRRLHTYARLAGADYSRYADDLAFSFRDDVPRDDIDAFIGDVGLTLGSVFRINHDKTRIMRSGTRQVVTGLVVNACGTLAARVPREIRRKFRAEQHRGVANPGMAAYLEMVHGKSK
jgi:RNA-directed DNA polymerase